MGQQVALDGLGAERSPLERVGLECEAPLRAGPFRTGVAIPEPAGKGGRHGHGSRRRPGIGLGGGQGWWLLDEDVEPVCRTGCHVRGMESGRAEDDQGIERSGTNEVLFGWVHGDAGDGRHGRVGGAGQFEGGLPPERREVEPGEYPPRPEHSDMDDPIAGAGVHRRNGVPWSAFGAGTENKESNPGAKSMLLKDFAGTGPVPEAGRK